MRKLAIKIGAAIEFVVADVKDIYIALTEKPTLGKHAYGQPGTYWAGQRQHVREMITA